jgi:hypothetical protein
MSAVRHLFIGNSGPRTGVPVILLNHLAAQLDNFDLQ